MFHLNIFPKSCKINFASAKLNPLCDPPYRCLELRTFSIFNGSVSFCTTSIALANIVFFATNIDAVMAQTPIASKELQASAKTMSQVNVLFVNPSVGDDKVGNADERTPLKTITRALQSAKPNTVIILSKGTYSAENGERFPLMLKPGVSIQGDQGNKGRDIVIAGGGDYLSRTFGGKNVTVVGADQARLTGVTVTNSNRRGYGLWIEYTSPIVAANTFTGNTQDGISITGNSQASVRNNHFERNGANGITITGNSRPEVRENVFQQTGFGINIAQNAQPMLIGNRIQNNRSGIVVQANSHPVLRNNLIQDNKEDGLVAISQATPDLGSPTEPGQNEFRNNKRYDINASAAKQMISAYGNTLRSDRITGQVDTNTKTATQITGTTAASASPTIPLSISFERSSNSRNLPNNSSSRKQYLSQQPKALPEPVASVNQKPSISNSKYTDFPSPTNLTTNSNKQPLKVNPSNNRQAATDKPNTSQLNYVQIPPVTVEFSASKATTVPPAQPPSSQGKQIAVAPGALQRLNSPRQSLPVESAPVQPPSSQGKQIAVAPGALQRLNSPRQSLAVESAPIQPPNNQWQHSGSIQRLNSPKQSLPVESAPIQPPSSRWQELPVVDGAPIPNYNAATDNSSSTQMPVPPTVIVTYNNQPSPRVTNVGQINLRYRVVVAAGSQQDEELVKFIAPGAFHTVWHSQEVMQVGVFTSRYNADNMLKLLSGKGLRAMVEPI